ncbi:DNA cytosine methyltransferase [Streptomyces sp. ISL-98]|nr:DNA methylase [Streptomyces sp. ISL-98]MBT2505123.1 DNA cytosine methyltransferase [Streptomyces sp. ISL-98]
MAAEIPPERPWNGLTVLDLCCCSGGASMGYWLAGFNVTGVDNRNRPRYPFTFVQADAIEYALAHGHEYDLIHASWPCQYGAAITKGTNAHLRDTYPNLLPAGRAAMLATGRPYVIENPEARPDLVLCGTQFGLPILRHRRFEVHGWTPMGIPHTKHRGRVRGHRHGKKYPGDYLAIYGKGGGKATVPEAQAALGITWTDVHEELTEAIPPAYTQFLGEQAAQQLAGAAA